MLICTKQGFNLNFFLKNSKSPLIAITVVETSIAITETETSIGIGEVAEIETDLVEMKKKGVGVETEVLTTKRLIFFLFLVC